MDTIKKPFKADLEMNGVLVEKSSGDYGTNQFIPAPTTISNKGFGKICKMGVAGIVLHRDLPDSQETKQGAPGQPAEHITTDKEEYVFIPLEGIRSFRTVVQEKSISDKK